MWAGSDDNDREHYLKFERDIMGTGFIVRCALLGAVVGAVTGVVVPLLVNFVRGLF